MTRLARPHPTPPPAGGRGRAAERSPGASGHGRSLRAGRPGARFFGIHAEPGRRLGWLLAVLPFAALVLAYVIASDVRHRDNPQDKLLPTIGQMAAAVHRLAFTEDPRTGRYTMLQDTLSSLRRLLLGVGIAAAAGLLLGLNMGLFPGMSATLHGFVTFVSMIPPLALLPILFISFGVEELSKVMLIIVGIFPVITRDVYLAVRRIPAEQVTKALTLGASELAVVYRVVLPQVLPRLLDALRLALGAAWLFLIAAEAIASTDGLGYRIFLVRRYLAMDVIIPYALWITFLGFALDWSLRRLLARCFGWYVAQDR